MSLKSKEVLVLPHHLRETGGVEYGIFLRASDCYWQGIAGGVEKGETPLETAKREAWEEGGISPHTHFIDLDSVSYFSIPINKDNGREEAFTVRQYAFAVEMTTRKFVLSDEHTEYRWVTYDEAVYLLKWDGDKLALKELRQRLLKDRKKTK